MANIRVAPWNPLVGPGLACRVWTGGGSGAALGLHYKFSAKERFVVLLSQQKTEIELSRFLLIAPCL